MTYSCTNYSSFRPQPTVSTVVVMPLPHHVVTIVVAVTSGCNNSCASSLMFSSVATVSTVAVMPLPHHVVTMVVAVMP